MRRIFGVESSIFGRLRQLYFAIPARRAKPASVVWNLFKTSMQSVVLWIVFLGIVFGVVLPVEALLLEKEWTLPRFQFPFSLAAALFIGGGITAGASAWALISHGEGTPLPLDATNRLVVSGPYRWVRNPMALSSLIQGAAIGLAVGSPLVLLCVGAEALLWNYGARPWEERDMENHFGEGFRHYKRHVRCWLPRVRPYVP